MRRDKTTEPEDLDRPEGNSLLENYDLHDQGEREFVERIESLGYRVEPWGIDMRHDDEGGLVYDDKLDFKVFAQEGSADGSGEDKLVALVDVKTKSSPQWMGQYNLRHFEKYKARAEEFDVPTFVVMFQVDRKGNLEDEFVQRIWDKSEVLTSKDHSTVRTFPDGNHKVVVPHHERETWTYLVGQIIFAATTEFDR